MLLAARPRHALTVVIIDDDPDHAALTRQAVDGDLKMHLLEEAEVVVFSDPGEALANLPVGETIVLCDYHFGSSCALDWMTDFARAGAGPVIVLTSAGSENIAASAFRQGAADYIVKSEVFEHPELLARAMREALRRNRLERRNTDLSRQLKQANNELQEKNATLAEITETAHRFVDDVAHEFRTPLTVVREFASIISDGIGGAVNPKQAEFLTHIEHAANDLAGLVDDFLDTSRLRARTLRVDRRSHTVDELFESVRATLVQRSASKGIRIVIQAEPDLGNVFMDLEKARRVVTNLAVNAIKFSPKDADILITAARAGDDDVVISVTDHGPGISPQDIESIFARFVQTDQARRPGVKGFGLGLAIAQELVALNLGKLAVRSELGKFTTFSFTVPADKPCVVLQRYFAHAAGEGRSGYVTMLRSTPTAHGSAQGELRDELVSLSHPWDLVIPTPGDAATVTLIGTTGEPDRWARRVEQSMLESRGLADPAQLPARLSLVGCWPADQAKSQITSKLASPSERKPPNAA